MPQQHAEEVRMAWGRIVRYLEKNAPRNFATLNSPATDEDLAATEQRMGIAFPSELKDLLKMNNGTTGLTLSKSDYYFELRPLPSGKALLDHRSILHNYLMYRSYAQGDAECSYWRVRWIPVIQNTDAPYGFFMDTEADSETPPLYSYSEDGDRDFAHSSLAAYLKSAADAFEGISAFKLRPSFTGIWPTVRDGMVHW